MPASRFPLRRRCRTVVKHVMCGPRDVEYMQKNKEWRVEDRCLVTDASPAHPSALSEMHKDTWLCPMRVYKR